MRRSFFGYVWRFNALAIAGVSVLALLLGTYGVIGIGYDLWKRSYAAHDVARVEAKPGDPASPRPPVATKLTVEAFRAVPGTSTLMAQVSADQSYDFRYSSKVASSTRNIVFYDRVSGKSRRLLDDDSKLILQTTELRADQQDAASAPLGFLFAVIDGDSNGDGMLNGDDQRTHVLTRADGQQVTKLAELSGIEIGTHVPANSTELVAMMRNGADVSADYVDLTTFKVVKQVLVTPVTQ